MSRVYNGRYYCSRCAKYVYKEDAIYGKKACCPVCGVSLRTRPRATKGI